MRLISADGYIDVLYDLVVVWAQNVEDRYNIMASNVFGNDPGDMEMASYSTEEDMKAELTRLHRAYEIMSPAVFRFRREKPR